MFASNHKQLKKSSHSTSYNNPPQPRSCFGVCGGKKNTRMNTISAVRSATHPSPVDCLESPFSKQPSANPSLQPLRLYARNASPQGAIWWFNREAKSALSPDSDFRCSFFFHLTLTSRVYSSVAFLHLLVVLCVQHILTRSIATRVRTMFCNDTFFHLRTT